MLIRMARSRAKSLLKLRRVSHVKASAVSTRTTTASSPSEDLDVREKANGPIPPQLRAADADNDGQWSYDELRTVAPNLTTTSLRARADKNGDGLLNRQELQALRRQDRAAKKTRASATCKRNATAQVRHDAITKLLQIDADDDGAVSFEEVLAAKPGYPREAFDRNDRNNDGVLSRQDMP
jgi:hypothetical protein